MSFMEEAGSFPFTAGPIIVPEWFTLGKVGFSNTSGKTLVPTYMAGVSTLSLFGISQSNGINGAPLDGAFVPDTRVHNYNFYDGKMYRAVDPLLGPETTDQVTLNAPGSHYMTKLGKLIVEAGIAQRVILTSISIGGAASSQWLGELKPRIRYGLRSLQQAGYPPNFILSDFGESDNIEGISAATLTGRLNSIVDEFRVNDCRAPFFIAQVAKYQGATNDAQIRLGQANTWNVPRRIFQGPDLDAIGDAYRAADKTHLLASGNTQKALAWFNTLQAFIAANP